MNEAPVLTRANATVTTTEGGTLTNNGTWSDPESNNVNLTANVGTVVKNANGTWNWSLATTDNVVGSIPVVITGSDGTLSSNVTFTYTITNVAPQVAANAGVTTGNEGSLLTRSGTWSDVAADTVTLSASVGAVVRNANGTWNWSFTVPNQTTAPVNVVITASDEDGGSRTTTFTYTATNVAPLVGATNASVSGNEGTTLVNTGTWSDVAADVVTLSASVGAVVRNANGTWNWSYLVPDQIGSTNVVITAADADGGSRTTTFTYSATNVAPQVAATNASVIGNVSTTIQNTGTWSDVAADTVNLTASIGSIVKNANGTWNWSLAAAATPSTGTVTITATDEDGGSRTTTFGLTVNDVPVVTLPTAAINYTENAGGLLVFNGATAVDSDAPSTTSTIVLTVTNTNAESTDRLQFLPSGVYTVVGSELRANGAAIATIAGGSGTTPLVITFNSNMARVQAVLNLIGFFSVSESPSTTPRVLSVQITDRFNATNAAVLRTVGVVSVNDVPVVTLPTSAATYVENAAALLPFAGSTVVDVDTPTITGGVLTITNTNGQTGDVLSLVPDATYTVSGTQLLASSVVIGSITGGAGTTPLVVTFSSAATLTRIQQVIARVGFLNNTETPPTTPRVINVTLTDGVGGTSAVKTRTVSVTSVNDVPVVTLPTTAISYAENAGALLVFTGATATDADLASATNTTATLTVTNTNGESTDRLTIVPSGVYTVVGSELRANGAAIATFTGGTGTTPLVLSFTTNMARIQAAIGLIGFSSTSDNPSTTSRVLSVVLTDAAADQVRLRREQSV